MASEKKVIGYHAPVAPEIIDDPQLFGRVVTMLLVGARGEAAKACEGRAYTIDQIRINIAPYDQPFYNEGDSVFIPNMMTAMLELRITITE